MNIDELIDVRRSWLGPEAGAGIAVSSRIRLARNLRDAPFPGKASVSDCSRIWEDLRPLLAASRSIRNPAAVGMENLEKLDKQIIFERHLISREHLERGVGSGFVLSGDERCAVMVNEEDHLRLQCLEPGLNLQGAWKVVSAIDDDLDEHIDYAFSPTLGYLTACPSNVGSGMRASVMLHVPGLVLMEEMNPIIKGMGKIGLAVRGLWGEGTEAIGNMFQMSNQITLGEKEGDIIANLDQIVQEIVDHEKNARLRLAEDREPVLRDHVGRAYGILTNAHILTSKEALDLLSGLRLGIDLGIFTGISWESVNDLTMLSQPGHLQKIEGRPLNSRERDEARARLIREHLNSSTS